MTEKTPRASRRLRASPIVFLVLALLAMASPVAAAPPPALPTLPTSSALDPVGALKQAVKAAKALKAHRPKHKLLKGPVDAPVLRTAPLALPLNKPPTDTAGPTGEPVDPVHMKVLILTATATDLTLPAIKQALDYIGTPYEVMETAPVPADPSTDRLAARLSDLPLATALNGFYQGVILTTGNLTYTSGGGYYSGLNPTEWTSLWAYEAKFGIRQVTWYTYPTQDYGFTGSPTAVDTTVVPLDVPFTAGGQAVFGSYLKTTTPLPIRNAYTYLDKPLDANTTPLLSDAAGNALAAVKNYPDGRQNLALTFSSNQYLLHNLLVSYGLVSWVTRGLFLGERHAYLSPQLDDLLIEDATWPAGTPCTTSLEDPSLPTYRISGADFVEARRWQNATQTKATTKNLHASFAFNGVGTTAEYYADYRLDHPTAPSTDGLTPKVRSDKEFYYVNHTYNHANLDTISYADAIKELTDNDAVGRNLTLPGYNKVNLITPDISGLANPAFLQGAYDYGTRSLVSDTSRGGFSDNPSPNVGIPNASQPGILQVPRRPVNLYFNVTTPVEWLAEDNCLYPVGAWGHVDTYDQLLERESNVLLTYLVKGDIDPLMFHQPNIRQYLPGKSLFSDLMDRALAKYNTYFVLPVTGLAQDVIGQKMIDRAMYNASGVTATFVPGPPGQGPTSVTITAQQAATVPITGLAAPGSELYGGQRITYVALAAGQSVTYAPGVSLSPASVDFGLVLRNVTSTRTVTLTNTGALPLAVTSIAVPAGPFSQTNTCGTSVAPQANCAITVRFRPTVAGNQTATLTVTDSAPNSPHTVALKGNGL